MKPTQPSDLLGGLTPQQFMRRHWQKKPLLIRGAMRDALPMLTRERLFALAARDDVESRLVVHAVDGWKLRHGPFGPRALPARRRGRWTLLVQGVDLQLDAAHALMRHFRFVPDARLDDLMVSYATDGGGVGPHFDSYDVFLLQLHGRRRWRIGRLADPRLTPGVPLKILSNFVPEQEWLLEPGDMLYLPPRWAHDGVAEGECMTASIGFRAERRDPLGAALLQHLLDEDEPEADSPMYRDPAQPAVTTPGRIPRALLEFAAEAVQRRLAEAGALDRALGALLTEPKPQVTFEPGGRIARALGVVLDRRSRMLYDTRHIYLNGEAYRAAGRDATLMRRLADRRVLKAGEVAGLGSDARALLGEWLRAGWLHEARRTPNEAARDGGRR